MKKALAFTIYHTIRYLYLTMMTIVIGGSLCGLIICVYAITWYSWINFSDTLKTIISIIGVLGSIFIFSLALNMIWAWTCKTLNKNPNKLE